MLVRSVQGFAATPNPTPAPLPERYPEALGWSVGMPARSHQAIPGKETTEKRNFLPTAVTEEINFNYT